MEYLLEYTKFQYKPDDIVLIHYSLIGNMVTPVKILKRDGNGFLITHNIDESEIFNAPDEKIKSTEIIDYFKGKKKKV
jgi:hypothetical protein